MKQVRLLSVFLMSLSLLVHADVNRLDVRSRVLLPLLSSSCTDVCASDSTQQVLLCKQALSAEGIDVFVRLDEGMGAEDLEALGMRDVVIVGQYAIGTADVDVIASLSEHPLVEQVSIAGKARLKNDLSRAASHVTEVRNGTDGLPQGYTGKGVVVSLFDQGIEPGHINFLTKDRKDCRVREIWHYNTTQDAMGQLQTKETSYTTPEAIAGFRTDDSTLTHGTHTLGVMAGSFGEEVDHDYSGMAPDADILIGCGTLQYANVAKALVRFAEYAQAHKQPLVVNLSFGDNIGPHDGSDAFPAVLDEVAKQIPICMSAGNEGTKKIALHKTFSASDTAIRTVISPLPAIRAYLGASYEAVGELQVWSEDTTHFALEMGLYNIETKEWVTKFPVAPDGEIGYIGNGSFEEVSQVQDDDFDYLYENSVVGIATGYDQASGRYMADAWILLKKQTNHIDRHIVPIIVVKGAEGKRADIYTDGEYMEMVDRDKEGFDDGMTDGTISNIACGKNTISVGSYCTRVITEGSVEGQVSAFSSWGELYDGRKLPTLLAPGDCIASSMSTPFTNSEYYSSSVYPAVYGVMYGENPYYWTIQQGTSQSAPAMAGIIALWLEANPYLTSAEIKQIAIETAAPMDSMTTQCGAGKVDALEGIKKALSMLSIESAEADGRGAYSIIQSAAHTYTICSHGGDAFEVNIYTANGNLVGTQQAANGQTEISTETLPQGMYVLHIHGKNGNEVKRIIR